MKRLIGVLLCALLAVASGQEQFVPVTALEAAPVVALPRGSVRWLEESCVDTETSQVRCYVVPGDLSELAYSLSLRFRINGWTLQRETSDLERLTQVWVNDETQIAMSFTPGDGSVRILVVWR